MNYPRARAKALSAAQKTRDRFGRKISRLLDHRVHAASKRQRRAVRTINAVVSKCRIAGYFPVANDDVWQFVTRTMVDQFLRLYARTGRDRRVRHFLFTAAFDDGIFSERAPVIPLTRIKRKVRRLLAAQRLNAVCMFQIDVLAKPLPGERDRGRMLLVHVHALVWTFDPKFRPMNVGRKMSRTRALRNRLGARSIDFMSRARSDKQWPDWVRRHPERDQTADSMAWLAHYLTKRTITAKNRRTSRKTGRTRLRPDARRLRQSGAARMAEISSRLELADVLFGVGDGQLVARAVRRRLTAWKRKSARHPVSRSEITWAWMQIFAARPEWQFDLTEFC